MEVLWSLRGPANVHEVAGHLDRPLAYTTVMTTLDRLYKKGLLDRRMPERAFYYSPKSSRREWERRIASDLLTKFMGGPDKALISSLVEAVGHDEALLDELEQKIRLKRKELRKEPAGRRKS